MEVTCGHSVQHEEECFATHSVGKMPDILRPPQKDSTSRHFDRPRTLYLDANATVRPLPAVVDAVLTTMIAHVGNPASAHSGGTEARRALEHARDEVASLAGTAEPENVCFVSGGAAGCRRAVAFRSHQSQQYSASGTRDRSDQRKLRPISPRQGPVDRDR